MHRKDFISKTFNTLCIGSLFFFSTSCENMFENDNAYKINEGKCSGCGDCLNSCHHHAISISDGVASISSSNCTGCGKCVRSCKQGAIYI